MTDAVLGWDVGGVNLKAARVERDGGAEPLVIEQPFAIWREPERLPALLSEIASCLGRSSMMAVTMTAELADCLATKREGGTFVLNAFRDVFPDVEPRIYGVDGRFHSLDAAREQPHLVAAANWMASATFLARTFSDALVVDVGSTTTDIIPIRGGRVAACGRTDPERLCCGELVYTGALRTPVCAIVSAVPLRGRRCRVASELFAIAADVHRWLGRIDDQAYTCDTPDGRGRSRPEAGARIARMVCADVETLTDRDIRTIAGYVTRAQVRQIARGIRQVMDRIGRDCPRLAVLAGQGAFLGMAAAEEAGLETRDLALDIGSAVARSTPAAAVAHLLAAQPPWASV